MATEISKRERNTFRWHHDPVNWLRIRLLGRTVNRIRKFRRRFESSATGITSTQPVEFEYAQATSLCGRRGEFSSTGFTFIEPFMAEASWVDLVRHWPPAHAFDYRPMIMKSYDMVRHGDLDPIANPAVGRIDSFLRSNELAHQIAALCDDDIDRALYSTMWTWAKSGSRLVLHRDSIAESTDEWSASFVNLIFFVAGSGPTDRAGGTVMSSSASWDDVIFRPPTLNNAALIYKSNAPLWHGFQRMAAGASRITINAQFCGPKPLVRNSDEGTY